MGLPSPFVTSTTRERSSAVPGWVSYLPLLLLVPLVPNPITTLFPPPPPAFITNGLAECAALDLVSPAELGGQRTVSDRFVKGTKPVLLVNGTIWTANDGDDNGQEIIYGGSVLLENGLIKAVGRSRDEAISVWQRSSNRGGVKHDLEEIELAGSWVTPGIVDMHAHTGVFSNPVLEGASDGNTFKGPIRPFLRSIDGLNTHDASYNLSIAGGVTTQLILPGSAGSIGGQAFVIKPRETAENTPSSMVVENPWVIGEHGGMKRTGYMRHMKHACGENPHRVYNDNRMDQAYNFRKAYTSATVLKTKQDEWCKVGAANKEPFPEDLEFEALTEVIRGKVNLNVHCYEAVDFDQLIRLSNEFAFEVSAVHHAHEAYLVPELLKKAYGRTPVAAIFATFKNYKREASRGSEFAAKILSEAGIKVAMKSDAPEPIASRYLGFEAGQVHHYGLNTSLALASITSVPANAIGMGHRMGHLRESYDADVVVWDSHPLSLGATPTHVFIDGISQLPGTNLNPVKPASYQKPPITPSFGDEAEIHKQARGDPPYAQLMEKKIVDEVVFVNVRHVYLSRGDDVQQTADVETVVVREGKIACAGKHCMSDYELKQSGREIVDLKGGSIIPGLTAYGSSLGLGENLLEEKSTEDGDAADGLAFSAAPILKDELIRAADGASFGSKDALQAAKFGVTKAITAPYSSSLIHGLSFAFSTRAAHPLAPNAILQEVTAVHVAIDAGAEQSVSTQFAMLRKLLLGKTPDEGGWWKQVREGKLPVVVGADKADIIARLITLKKEVEEHAWNAIRMIISGGAEAHLIAPSLSSASIGVILTPHRMAPLTWSSRRSLPSPPLSPLSPLTTLLHAGVTVALGTHPTWAWQARNTRLEVGWALVNTPGLTVEGALRLVTVDLERMLGLEDEGGWRKGDWVAVEGEDLFGFGGKVVAAGGVGKGGEQVAIW